MGFIIGHSFVQERKCEFYEVVERTRYNFRPCCGTHLDVFNDFFLFLIFFYKLKLFNKDQSTPKNANKMYITRFGSPLIWCHWNLRKEVEIDDWMS